MIALSTSNSLVWSSGESMDRTRRRLGTGLHELLAICLRSLRRWGVGKRRGPGRAHGDRKVRHLFHELRQYFGVRFRKITQSPRTHMDNGWVRKFANVYA